MLHLPMEPSNYPSVNPGPGALLSTMNPDELLAQLNANLDRGPQCPWGEQPHGFPKLTASSEQMRQIFHHPEKTGALFSWTAARRQRHPVSTVGRTAPTCPFAERDVFIDHEQTPEFVRKATQAVN
jgi:polysaccharide deacetylase 2 family uncharacterized protein YibQ